LLQTRLSTLTMKPSLREPPPRERNGLSVKRGLCLFGHSALPVQRSRPRGRSPTLNACRLAARSVLCAGLKTSLEAAGATMAVKPRRPKVAGGGGGKVKFLTVLPADTSRLSSSSEGSPRPRSLKGRSPPGMRRHRNSSRKMLDEGKRERRQFLSRMNADVGAISRSWLSAGTSLRVRWSDKPRWTRSNESLHTCRGRGIVRLAGAGEMLEGVGDN
jgi:hypothetical protein